MDPYKLPFNINRFRVAVINNVLWNAVEVLEERGYTDEQVLELLREEILVILKKDFDTEYVLDEGFFCIVFDGEILESYIIRIHI